MPQMLHSVYDLQEAMEYSVFKMNYEEAARWVNEKLSEPLLPQKFGPLTQAQMKEAERNQFEQDFNVMCQMATVVVPENGNDDDDEDEEEDEATPTTLTRRKSLFKSSLLQC